MWRDPGTWIALGVSALFVVVGLVMHRVFTRILKQGSAEPGYDNHKAENHE
ncbi:hypothetical protein [Acidovorax soli]|uniref:hypothetical protein n=1 Tax=Acidovorax TaxID=12916 RepID=UPI0026ED4D0F|nr:hypothetical protein [Acidovorax soli]MCM2346699.1 hypothetical protein [Acidovorax soli]